MGAQFLSRYAPRYSPRQTGINRSQYTVIRRFRGPRRHGRRARVDARLRTGRGGNDHGMSTRDEDRNPTDAAEPAPDVDPHHALNTDQDPEAYGSARYRRDKLDD